MLQTDIVVLASCQCIFPWYQEVIRFHFKLLQSAVHIFASFSFFKTSKSTANHGVLIRKDQWKLMFVPSMPSQSGNTRWLSAVCIRPLTPVPSGRLFRQKYSPPHLSLSNKLNWTLFAPKQSCLKYEDFYGQLWPPSPTTAQHIHDSPFNGITKVTFSVLIRWISFTKRKMKSQWHI